MSVIYVIRREVECGVHSRNLTVDVRHVIITFIFFTQTSFCHSLLLPAALSNSHSLFPSLSRDVVHRRRHKCWNGEMKEQKWKLFLPTFLWLMLSCYPSFSLFLFFLRTRFRKEKIVPFEVRKLIRALVVVLRQTFVSPQ